MIKKVNWSQALVEVVLLILGASLALALDGWNDRRLDRRAEHEYLLSLKSDFGQTHNDFTRALEGNAEVRDWNLATLRLLSGPPGSVPLDSLRRPDARNFWIWEFSPVLGTYRDLLQSGRLDLISSDSLRIALIQFESGVRRLEMNVDLVFQEWSEYQAPYLVEHLDVPRFVGGEYRGIEFPGSRFPPDPAEYWSSGYASLLAITAMRRQDLIRDATRQLGEVEMVLRLIGKALEDW